MIQAVTELPPSHALLPFEDKSENWAFADPMSGAVRSLALSHSFVAIQLGVPNKWRLLLLLLYAS